VNNSGLPAGGDMVTMQRLIEQLKLLMTMIKSLLKIGALSLLAVAIAGAPASLRAQSTNNPAPEKKTAAPKTRVGHPFHGKLAAVDKVAKTIKVGESIYQITSKTKIIKAGKPATLEDGVVGDLVTGFARPTDDGKMAAISVHFGAKPQDKSGEQKKGT
jgi:hypothetical protein